MVSTRAQSKLSLCKFVTLCVLHALCALPALDATAAASNSDAKRSLAVHLSAEGGDGSPVTWDNNAMQVTSVVSVTAKDSPIPAYGTDMDQPTLPPDDSNGSIIIFTNASFDVTSEPETPEPPTVLPLESPSEPATETLQPATDTLQPATDTPQPTTEPSEPTILEPGPAAESPEPTTPAPTPTPGYDVNPRLFATKTAYWDQRDLFIANPVVQELKQKTEQELQNLTLLQIQQVNRHGTRFPKKTTIEEIMSLIEKLQTEYASLIPAWLQSYSLPYDVSIEDTLAQPGFVELEMFGARTRDTVGAALPIEFAEASFILQHTYKADTKDSATSFAKAFFSNPDEVQYIEYSKMEDRFLRYFDECPRYNNEVADNSSAFAELNSFRESAVMVQNLEFLKVRLNLPSTADLTQADLESAYSACAFDIALYNTYSNWCTLLNNDAVKALDFAEDLENFYEKGPGYKISYEISAVLLKDIYAFMKDLISGKTQVVGNFRFAHAETTLPLMTLLGYGDRTPLLASFSADEIAFRGFRASVLAPLASNIDFRLYESKSDSSKHFVQVLVNERVAPVPGCGGAVFCELSKVEQLWGYYLNTYDFDADCKVK